jgi:AcrR family transcriptional regulator
MLKRPQLEAGLERLADTFRKYGYDGATVSILSQATGLGRASMYHHYPGGKEEMAARALSHVGERAQALVLDSLKAPGAPALRLKRFARAIAAFYRDGQANCMLGTMVLSGGAEACGDGLKEGIHDWLTAIAAVLMEAGLSRSVSRRRAEDALVQIQGALIVSRCLGSERPFLRTVRDLPRTLLAEAGGRRPLKRPRAAGA